MLGCGERLVFTLAAMGESFRERLHLPYYDYIPQRGLKNLAKYKYSGMDLSLIAKYILHPFWTWLANYLPEWPAPNLITFAGFVPCLASFILTAYYCPTLSEAPPQWLCALNFLCLWLYQTLDALDGKQARRTGTSSPLGELFDHGCDALTTIFVGLSVACTIRIGSQPLVFLLIIMMLVPFYTTQWEEYFTGTLVLGYIGVTEGQLVTLAIYLVAAIFGTDLYLASVTLPLLGTLPINNLLVILTTLSSGGHVIYNALTVFNQWRAGKATAFNALGYLGPVSIVVVASAVWQYVEPTVITAHAHIYLCMLGLIVANFVGRIIVYRVCGLDAAFFPELLLPLVIGTINALLGNRFLPTYIAVYANFLFYAIAYLHFAVCIINQMTTYLNIRCFVIPVPNLASNPPVKPAGGVPTPEVHSVHHHAATAAHNDTDSPASAKRNRARGTGLSPAAQRKVKV